MAREYFPAYHSYLEAMEELTDAEKGRLFTACLLYSKTGEAQELSGNERYLFPAFKSQIDRDNAEYAKRCATNRRNGQLGGNRLGANWGERPPNAPRTPPKKKEKTKEKEKEKKNITGDIPPTPLPGGSPALQKAFSNWLQYKREKRQDYKPTGLQSLVTQVQRAAETYGEQAVIDLIGECMANNWQGIIFDRLGGGRAQRPPSFNAPVPDSGAEQRVREDLERMRAYMRENRDDP